MIRWILAPLCCLLSLVCCGSSNDGSPDDGRRPALNLRSPPGTEPMRRLRGADAQRVARAGCAFRPRWPPVVVTAAEVYEQGTRYTGTRFTVEGPRTDDRLCASTPWPATRRAPTAACSRWPARPNTPIRSPMPGRAPVREIPPTRIWCACYGGSTHRTPYKMDGRPFCADGELHGCLGPGAVALRQLPLHRVPHGRLLINLGQHLDSGTRKHWEELLDYWLGDPATGVGV